MNHDIHTRIAAVVAESGLTKTAFAARINLSQQYVSMLCNGTKTPSDRTISDICREFGVSETWLRTGEGEMFVPVKRDEEISAFIGRVMADEKPDFRRRLIAVLSRLDESQWKLLEDMALQLVEEMQEKEEG